MIQTSIAHRLGAFIATAAFERLPVDVVEKAKRHTLDTFGATLAGAASEEARRAANALPDGPGTAPIWGTRRQCAPGTAALLNGIAAHAFELDDTGGCDHSGAVVLPAAGAALSLVDRPVTGKAFLTAVVLGYDVGRRVLEAFGGYRPHNEAGWHSTGTCGTFAAAAATASILRLTATETTASLGIAASFSGGLWAFIHDGAMTKRVHAGRAAEGGLLAARLAQAGVTGPACVFEDVWGGFLSTYAHGPVEPEALTRELGRDWRIMTAAIKPYACCRDTHAAVDAIGRILERRPLIPDEIGAIRARLNPFLAGMVGGRDVDTLPAAQMSLPYAVAARILFGTAGLSAYTAERRADPQLHALIDRVSIDMDESVPGSDRASVSVCLRDGEVIEEPTSKPLGGPDHPISDQDLLAKFEELAGTMLETSQVHNLSRAVFSIEDIADVRILLPLLQGASNLPPTAAPPQTRGSDGTIGSITAG